MLLGPASPALVNNALRLLKQYRATMPITASTACDILQTKAPRASKICHSSVHHERSCCRCCPPGTAASSVNHSTVTTVLHSVAPSSTGRPSSRVRDACALHSRQRISILTNRRLIGVSAPHLHKYFAEYFVCLLVPCFQNRKGGTGSVALRAV